MPYDNRFMRIVWFALVVWTALIIRSVVEKQLEGFQGAVPLNTHTHRRTAEIPLIYICALSKSQPEWKDMEKIPVMDFLVASIAETTKMSQAQYNITVLLGVDSNDLFWKSQLRAFESESMNKYGLVVRVNSYASHGNGVLPFNSLMRDAFNNGAQYMVRVNDDTQFTSSGWIELGIAQLLAFKPPNVGVVGPMCHQGNTKIMTHDMVHRTHLLIFDTYYPSLFDNWYVDDWISTVYGPARTSKLHSWVVHHHVELGTRYTPSTRDSTQLQPAVAAGVLAVEAYLKTLVTPWVVLVTVSAGFDDMFQNWQYWYRRLNLDSRVVVFAEDKLTYDKYNGVEGLEVWNTGNDTGTYNALDYNTLLYKQIVSRRSSHLLRLFGTYTHIIYTDIDTVWLRDPRPYFTGDYDMWAQLDGPQHICTGFMALKKTSDVLELLTLWNSALVKKNQLNQPVFNRLLHASSVKYAELSTVHFPSGKVLWENIRAKLPEAVVVHNNYIIGKQSKILRFQKSQLWMPLPLTAHTDEPPTGTQMSKGQIHQILAVLPQNGNLLVWGLGNDSPFWHNATAGRVVFIEDDVIRAKTLWYDIITRKFPFLEAYKVHYTTHTVSSFDRYIASPSLWKPELDLRSQLPPELTRVRWDVIIIDAPLGCCDRGPGRYQSIYTSKLLAQSTTHIFVDDFERKVEKAFTQAVFGSKPFVITQRNINGMYTSQEQAYFVVGNDTAEERTVVLR
jgi:hypothetical protein